MKKTFSLLCLFSVIGCSSIRFTSYDTIPVVFEKREDHTRDISIKVSKEFYLWGLFPGTRELRIDKEFVDRGYDSIAEVEIEEDRQARDIAWTLFTLGFYTPKSYVLKGKTKRNKLKRSTLKRNETKDIQ